VLWKPQFFGVKPELVLKGGMIAYAQMGDPNASIPTPGPVYMRPMFASFGRALHATSLHFMSLEGVQKRVPEDLQLRKRVVAVSNCRKIGKSDMKHNALTPKIEVNPETYEVFVNGELATCRPASELPMAQRYFLF
jgi:urease subunit alpha